MTGPLAWLLLSALALLAPHSHSPEQWTGRPLAVVASPPRPKEGTRVHVVIAFLPRASRDVVVEGGGHHAVARRSGASLRRASLPSGTPGPLQLSVRFTLHGTRYTAPGGVVFVVPDT
jgi:hypothetical protein